MRYLAIDYGSKNTGLALCDRDETVASPFKTLKTQKNLVAEIKKILDAESIDAVVVGLPLNMDGSQGPQARLVLDFVEGLKEQLGVSVYLQDERLTSFAAEEKLADVEMSAKRRKHRINAVAAAEILTAFLEAKAADQPSG